MDKSDENKSSEWTYIHGGLIEGHIHAKTGKIDYKAGFQQKEDSSDSEENELMNKYPFCIPMIGYTRVGLVIQPPGNSTTLILNGFEDYVEEGKLTNKDVDAIEKEISKRVVLPPNYEAWITTRYAKEHNHIDIRILAIIPADYFEDENLRKMKDTLEVMKPYTSIMTGFVAAAYEKRLDLVKNLDVKKLDRVAKIVRTNNWSAINTGFREDLKNGTITREEHKYIYGELKNIFIHPDFLGTNNYKVTFTRKGNGEFDLDIHHLSEKKLGENPETDDDLAPLMKLDDFEGFERIPRIDFERMLDFFWEAAANK